MYLVCFNKCSGFLIGVTAFRQCRIGCEVEICCSRGLNRQGRIIESSGWWELIPVSGSQDATVFTTIVSLGMIKPSLYFLFWALFYLCNIIHNSSAPDYLVFSKFSHG